MSINAQVYILYSISSRSIILVSTFFGHCRSRVGIRLSYRPSGYIGWRNIKKIFNLENCFLFYLLFFYIIIPVSIVFESEEKKVGNRIIIQFGLRLTVHK
jgi:hypothetical protein